MDFQRARTQEQVTTRQQDIMNACETLFCTRTYDDVNMKNISEITSIARPTIYNYYQCKEEILLDLLKRCCLSWNQELCATLDNTRYMNKEEYCQFLSESLDGHDLLLTLLSIYQPILEKSARPERLSLFLSDIAPLYQTIQESTSRYFPMAMERQKKTFLTLFKALLCGIYPITHPSDAEIKALKQMDSSYSVPDFQDKMLESLLYISKDL